MDTSCEEHWRVCWDCLCYRTLSPILPHIFLDANALQRKLPWTSTLEVSLTLALANPFLWYLLDRSKPGLLLSTTVGLIGTTGILALDSGLVPSPLAVPSGYNSTADAAHGSGFLSEGFLKDKAESAIWITSVLFCSVLCFGHIGRRLALLRRRSRA